jgi:hypothetical protein
MTSDQLTLNGDPIVKCTEVFFLHVVVQEKYILENLDKKHELVENI